MLKIVEIDDCLQRAPTEQPQEFARVVPVLLDHQSSLGLPDELLTFSFEDFKKLHSVREEFLKDPTVKWNADQLTIINAFTTNEFFTADNFLDSQIDSQTNYPDFFCKSTTTDDLHEVEFTQDQAMVIDLIERNELTKWAGEPCDARGKFLVSACEIEGTLPIMDILKENKGLEGFYLA